MDEGGKMSKNNDYYVYVYSHPDTRQPFYVGGYRDRSPLTPHL